MLDRASPPSSAASRSPPATSRSASTTRSPSACSRRAIASPIPRAAPVTTAVRAPTRPRRGCAASTRAAARPPRPSRDGERLGEDRERGLLVRVGADVEPARACDALERLLVDARLAQPLAPPLLVAARAERADVERLGLERRLQRGHVELVVVGEDDDRRRVVGRDLRERLLGPRDDQLVGARDPLGASRTWRARRRRSSSSRAASRRGRAPRRCRRRRRRAGAAAARRPPRRRCGRRARASGCGRRGSARRRARPARAGRRRSSRRPRRRAASSRAPRPRRR